MYIKKMQLWCISYIWLIVTITIANIEFVLTRSNSSKVLLISIDGFRWDFRTKTHTPYLDKIVEQGVTSEFVYNVFPTSTLPNHQSIVTGLYPENHGVIDNSFMDPATGCIFRGLMGDVGLKWWNQSTPIWTVNELQGHKSGVLFWPGYRVKYEGRYPSFLPPDKYTPPYEPGRHKMSVSDRIDMAVSWLKEDDVNLVVLYTEEPDDAAHNFAPDSNKTKNIDKVKKAIETVDDSVKYLNEKLEEEDLDSKVNVILIGDHGHVNTTYLHNLHLDDIFDTKKETRFIGAFTDVFIYPKAEHLNHVYESLKNATANTSHYEVYLKKDIPERLHIKNHNYTADILLLPDPGWTATADINEVPYLKGEWERGDHGYSNEHRLMNPAFFAYGPAFRKGYQKKCINTVDIYSLIGHILKLKVPESDGKFERIKSVLQEDVINETTQNDRDVIALECK